MKTKPPTIKDVAGALGMHKSTVSLALSGKGNIAASTRVRVMSVARELGYEPNPLAQRLANGNPNPEVCIVTGALDVGLATEKILLIQNALIQQSLEVPIYTCSEPVGEAGRSQAAQVKQICRQQPRAIICYAQMIDPGAYRAVENYQDLGGIVISYDLPIPLDCDQVVFDREDNGYQAARQLLIQGHRRVGIGMSSTHNWKAAASYLPHTLRLNGFRRALEEFGAPVREDWFFQNTTYERGGVELAQRFLQMKDRPTGLCIVNDYMALAFMVEIRKAGVRVPQDVSVVGLDNQPIAAYCPVPLTSISQPAEKISDAVVALLQERIAGSREAAQTVTIQGEVVLRESVSAPSVSF